MNKYKKYYNSIVKNAQVRSINGYTEKHHIVPRSLGGSDDTSNIVKLTAREHFICHWLLTKFVDQEHKGKMINALQMMRAESNIQERYTTKITARVYEHLRKDYAEYISNLNKGRVQPLHEKKKQIEAMTGRKRKPFSKEWKEKLSQSSSGENNPMYGKTHSEETRRKIADKMRGRKHSEELIERRISKIRGLKRKKKLCPHCNREIAVNTYNLWHGDKCRENKANNPT